MRVMLLAATIAATMATRAEAQCADGSPPPCPTRRPAAPVAPVVPTIDANRVAILPFRVAASDTLLGEGFAELLASEFTGQGMPRAVDMGTALQAWRRAGGGLRSALNRQQMLSLARSLGAGIVSEGSIVGLGRQLTITASLVDVVTGRPRTSVARVSVPADSIDYALRRVAAILAAPSNAPSQVVVSDDARFTENPEALRHYLEGLALWRNGRFGPAASAWDRAIALDSLFARAMYRRLIAQTWGMTGRVTVRQVFDLRDRLSDAERTVLLARYGSDPDARRSVDEVFEDTETAVRLLPDNADVLYTAGDAWHHMGAIMDPVNHLRRAVTYFGRAAAIDSQATVLQHMLEGAYRLRDTTLMRQAAAALERTSSRSRWQLAWLTASYLRDERWLTRLRTQRPESQSSPAPYLLGMVAAVPPALYDEMFARWAAVADSGAVNGIKRFAAFTMIGHGRPAAARAMFGPTEPTGRNAQFDAALSVLLLTEMPQPDTAAAEAWLNFQPAPSDTAGMVGRKCLRAALALKRGQPVDVDTTGFGQREPACARAIRILRIPAMGEAAMYELVEMDSIVRHSVMDRTFDAYEAVLLARAWERAGQPLRALRAIRYRETGNAYTEVPWNYAEEGRLAAIAGDRGGAIRAYTLWLEIMQGAEPAYDAKRAEVRAALEKLRGATP
jgi:tetratricopeptide (TPR) repeat protein